MKRRQLYIAFDEEGNKNHIDKIDKLTTKKFFCIHCKEEVIPKQGEKNIWHFAHKDQICSFLLGSAVDDGNNAKLDFADSPGISLSKIDMGTNSPKFICVKCKKTFNKLSGKKWDATEYICDACFNNL